MLFECRYLKLVCHAADRYAQETGSDMCDHAINSSLCRGGSIRRARDRIQEINHTPSAGEQYNPAATISAAVPSNDTDNTSLNVEIASDVYSDKDRRVLYCVRGNYVIVRNRIFITGPDVDKVKKVTYLLHPTFPNPVVVSEDRDSNFEIWIWCWGGFLIRASITTTTGHSIEKEYQFTFKEKFDDARSKGIPMIMTCNV